MLGKENKEASAPKRRSGGQDHEDERSSQKGNLMGTDCVYPRCDLSNFVCNKMCHNLCKGKMQGYPFELFARVPELPCLQKYKSDLNVDFMEVEC